uniref:Uncharacterized protein n=1 Tax=Romanomermis culicivorax TaxID=13658 RepID=A0A915HYX0_ROMCU
MFENHGQVDILAYKLGVGSLQIKYLRNSYKNYSKHESHDERVNVLRNILQDNDVPCTRELACAIQDAYGGSRQGVLTYDEFCIALFRYLKPETYDISARSLFKGFDKKNENKIRITEGVCLLRRMGFNNDVVEKFNIESSRSGKNYVDKNEMLNFIKTYRNSSSRSKPKGSKKLTDCL